MKIIVVGAQGTIGIAVVAALSARHDVVGVSRSSTPKLDLTDIASIEATLARVGDVEAVISCAGEAAFKPLADLQDADFASSLRSKLMGQIDLTRVALRHLRDRGSVTLTSGTLAHSPTPSGAALSTVNAGLEGFVRAAAIEAPRGIRVNVVSPGWVKETLAKLGMDPVAGLAAHDIAKAYVAAVEGTLNGEVLDPLRYLL